MQSAELLNKHLAAAIDLQALVRREYWNIRQPRFIAILELSKISAEVKNHSDLIGVAL
jgi:starvation-inducible DNA-binding protein